MSAQNDSRDASFTAQFRLRIQAGSDIAVGPGKIALLEAIARSGSISAGGREMGMSYRRAWMLVDQMNHYFSDPVVRAAAGGSHGGGTELTELGAEVVRLYREIESVAEQATQKLLKKLIKKIPNGDMGQFGRKPRR